MMRTTGFVLLTCLLLGVATGAHAQLNVTGSTPAEELVEVLLGESDATVSNATLTGDPRCAGTFTGGNGLGLGALGFESGIVLSSGLATDSPGPNLVDNESTNFVTPGDAFLDSLSGQPTFDACILEFDFECPPGTTPEDDMVSFEYVFGSDEYNEFVLDALGNPGFNDVFGFQLNGTNIAIIPGSAGVPVSITNLNCGDPFNPGSPTTPNVPFCDLFINNDLSDGGGSVDLELDGLSVALGAEGTILPGANNIRLAIGDARDRVFDTWMFLKEGSFQCTPLNQPPEASCQDQVVPADDTCQGDASVDNGSTDPDLPDDTIEIDESPGSPYPLGDTDVTLTVTDAAGATDECSAIVSVVDDTPPDLTCGLVPVCIALGGDDDDDDGHWGRDDDDDGGAGCTDLLEVAIGTSDNCDADSETSAQLVCDGRTIPVSDGVLIDFSATGVGGDDDEVDDDDGDSDCRVRTGFGGVLHIEGPALTLEATATDAAGNEAQCSVAAPIPPAIDDDD